MKKQLLHIYFKVRTYGPIWYNILNKKRVDLFKKQNPTLSPTQQRILKDLKRDGIALTTLDELFPGQNQLAKLKAFAQSLNPEDAEQGKKSFLKKYWDKHPMFDLSNPFLSLTLMPTILDVVNSYMGMWTKLKYYDLALTIPVPEGTQAVQSQRWHRDPEEKKICKVFFYLYDVDETAGPFTHVKQSNYGSKFGSLFPQKTPEGIYPPEGAVEKTIPSENYLKAIAPAGTVIFCDTSGLHRGGYATKKERLMYTAFFSSGTYSEKAWYKLPQNIKEIIEPLSPQAQASIEIA